MTNIFSFKGNASKKGYWFTILGLFIIGIIASVASKVMLKDFSGGELLLLGIILMIVGIMISYLHCALIKRRANDAGVSGWGGIWFIILANVFVLIAEFIPGFQGIEFLLGICTWIVLIHYGFLKSKNDSKKMVDEG